MTAKVKLSKGLFAAIVIPLVDEGLGIDIAVLDVGPDDYARAHDGALLFGS